MDIRQIEAFLSIARLGSFRAAAHRLGLTQPAISARMNNLEAELGVRLLERSTGSVKVTAKGAELLGLGEELLSCSQRICELAKGPAASPKRVRLGITESALRSWFPELITKLTTDHPRMAVDITVDETAHIKQLLYNGDIDVGIVTEPSGHPGIKNLRLATSELVWIGQKAIPLFR